MEAEFFYYIDDIGSEKDIRFVTDENSPEFADATSAYFMRLRLDQITGSLIIPVPETVGGKPVTMVGITPELPDDRPVPKLPEPLILNLSIPSKVRDIRIGKSLMRNSESADPINGEKLNVLNGTEIKISPDNRNYCVFGHGIYSTDMTRLYHIILPGKESGVFSVPAGVRRIWSLAGCGIKGMKKLIVPESVSEIGSCAFESCTDLEEAEIHAKKLSSRAFYGCTSLAKLTLYEPDLVYENTFEDCGYIGSVLKDALERCYKLRKFKYGADKDTDGFDLALDCRAITPDPNDSSYFPKSVFKDRDRLVKLALSDVETVGYGVFHECKSLGKLVVKNTAYIGQYAFMSCHGLRSAYLDCREIYELAFLSCEALEKLALVNTEVIKLGAFSHCKALKNVKLPDTLRRLEKGAFYMTGIRRLTIPPNVRELGKEIIGSGVIEIISQNNTLTPPSEDILHAGAPGVTLAVCSGETGEIFYELDLTYSLTDIFTGFGIDQKAYDEFIEKPYDPEKYDGAFFSAGRKLKNFKDIESGVFAPLIRYVSELAALNVLEMTGRRDYNGISEYPYFDDIEDECFMKLIGYSAELGAADITALLMQKLHERQKTEHTDPAQGEF